MKTINADKLWDWILLNSSCDSLNMWSLKDFIDSLAQESEPVSAVDIALDDYESYIAARDWKAIDKLQSARAELASMTARLENAEGSLGVQQEIIREHESHAEKLLSRIKEADAIIKNYYYYLCASNIDARAYEYLRKIEEGK
jgi:hypothetical protein